MVAATGNIFSIDMTSSVRFFPVGFNDIITASSSEIVFNTPFSTIQTIRGNFSFGFGFSSFAGSITSVSEDFLGVGNTRIYEINNISLTVDQFFSFANRFDDQGLLDFIFRNSDTISGSTVGDVLLGFDGNDVIHGNGGADRLIGGAGNDTLFGDGGDDILFGQAGSDTLVHFSGSDSLFGGADGDRYVIEGLTSGRSVFIGEQNTGGVDVLDLSFIANSSSDLIVSEPSSGDILISVGSTQIRIDDQLNSSASLAGVERIVIDGQTFDVSGANDLNAFRTALGFQSPPPPDPPTTEDPPIIQIRIEGKPVNFLGFDSNFDHLYLVGVDDAGRELVIRGGPTFNIPPFFGNIVVEVGVLMTDDAGNDLSEDSRPDTDGARFARGSTVLQLGDRDADEVWDIMLQQARNIQNSGFEYKASVRAYPVNADTHYM